MCKKRITNNIYTSAISTFTNFFTYSNKAVAEGALSFYLDHRVSARVAKKTYGVDIYEVVRQNDSQHNQRAHKYFTDAAGHLCVADIFSVILPKETRVSESKEFRRSYFIRASEKARLWKVKEHIRCYHGPLQIPKWMDTEPDDFSVLCTVEADVSEAVNAIQPSRGVHGGIFYEMEFSIVLLFGLTELKAQICWQENGIEKRSPAKIVYDIDNTISDK